MKKQTLAVLVTILIVAFNVMTAVAKTNFVLGMGMISHTFKVGDGLDMISTPSFTMVGRVQNTFNDNYWIGVEAAYVPRISSSGHPWRVNDDNRGERVEINSSLISSAVLVGRSFFGFGFGVNYMPYRNIQSGRTLFLQDWSWGYVVTVHPRIVKNFHLNLQYFRSVNERPNNIGLQSIVFGVRLLF